MKFFLCIVGVFLALVQVQCDPLPEMKQRFEECEKKIGVTADLIKEQPDDPNVKCFHACMMKKRGKLVDGKIDLENVLKHVPEKSSDSVKAGITECANKANEEKEECDVAGAFHKCFMENVRRH